MQRTILSLVEKYITLSGEAPLMGHPAYLIRFSGCNLDCAFCDTPYRNEENIRISAADLIADIQAHTHEYPQLIILCTGGEPLLQKYRQALIYIIDKLPRLQFYIETNGTIPVPETNRANCHYIVDWKAPSAEAGVPFAETNLKQLKHEKDCIKIVTGPEDLDWAKKTIACIKKSNPQLPVFISPVWGKLSLSQLAEFILTNKLPVSLSFQLHKLIWGAHTRGV
ncbi:MAG: radical SAM protein [Spirochaetales bacterium]|nr:radical SAM protein [Spirochaetales bacterium]